MFISSYLSRFRRYSQKTKIYMFNCQTKYMSYAYILVDLVKTILMIPIMCTKRNFFFKSAFFLNFEWSYLGQFKRYVKNFFTTIFFSFFSTKWYIICVGIRMVIFDQNWLLSAEGRLSIFHKSHIDYPSLHNGKRFSSKWAHALVCICSGRIDRICLSLYTFQNCWIIYI